METKAAATEQFTYALLNGTEDGHHIYAAVLTALDKGLPVKVVYRDETYIVRRKYSVAVFSRWMRKFNGK